MPADSEHAARQWIEARSRENPQAVAASTLAEQRKEKIRLECALLSLRLQREQENTELLPTKECYPESYPRKPREGVKRHSRTLGKLNDSLAIC
jgi:hypothetical protein